MKINNLILYTSLYFKFCNKKFGEYERRNQLSFDGTHLKENKLQYWIPEGFVHGFISLKDFSEVQYKTNEYWVKDYERSLFWKITWPLRAFRDGLQVVLSLFTKIETKDSKQETKIENLVEDNSKEKEEVLSLIHISEPTRPY